MPTIQKADSRQQVLLGLGANVGDRWANLRRAIQDLDARREITVLTRSSVYESEPAGYADQPRFLNLVVGVETVLAPEELLAATLEIERGLGRVRSFANAPRTLDIDILFFGNRSVNTERLQVPHPHFAERPFVVVPMDEVLRHPAFQGPLWDPLRATLKTDLPRSGVWLWEEQE